MNNIVAIDSVPHIRVFERMVDGEVQYETEITGLSEEEREGLPFVNLSRGGHKLYRLDRLSDHNGTGATWKGQDEAHSEAALEQYRKRVAHDIAEAWKSFVANRRKLVFAA